MNRKRKSGGAESDAAATVSDAYIDRLVDRLVQEHVVQPNIEQRLDYVVQKFKEQLGDRRCVLARYLPVLEKNYKIELSLKLAKRFKHLDLSAFYNTLAVRREEARLYRLFFEDLIYRTADAEVSFATGNTEALGDLTPRDYFTLAWFQMLTVSRSSENLQLALALTGKSSVGKSQLSRPLTHHFKTVCNQRGVGTLSAEHGVTGLLFQDIPMVDLLDPQVFHFLKLASRNEVYYSKVYAASTKNPPLFVVVVTNCRIQDHVIDGVHYPRDWQIPKGRGGSGDKKIDEAKFVEPLSNRFLELHFLKRPAVREKAVFDAKLSGRDAALGVYGIVLELMQRLPAETHFNNVAFKSHVLYGLVQTTPSYMEVAYHDLPAETQREEKRKLCGIVNDLRTKFEMESVVPPVEWHDDAAAAAAAPVASRKSDAADPTPRHFKTAPLPTGTSFSHHGHDNAVADQLQLEVPACNARPSAEGLGQLHQR